MEAEERPAYVERLERAVLHLAASAGLDAEEERDRFRRFWRAFDGPVGAHADGGVEAPLDRVMASLPAAGGIVLTHRGGKLAGFGVMGLGRRGGSFPVALAGMLERTLRWMLEEGADPEEAGLLADLFRLCYPDVGRLAYLGPETEAMLVGYVPAPSVPRFKVYLKTRLDPGVRHADLIRRTCARLELDDRGFYDLLYEDAARTRFHGIGVDLDGDGTRRLKLYVHLEKDVSGALLETFEERLCDLGGGAHRGMAAEVRRWVSHLGPEVLLDTLEIGPALRSDGPPSFKLSLFTRTKAAATRVEGRVAELAGWYGIDWDAVGRVVEALRDEGGRSPVTSVGFETPLGADTKVNLYLQPPVDLEGALGLSIGPSS